MNIKTQLLKLLESNRDAHISGADLARELDVSRNAVWKAVESLRAEGYGISAVPNKGYRLDDSGDILSAAGISGFLRHGGAFIVHTRKSVTSTNTVLRDMAASGAPEGTVLAAETQTAGKGRQGRSFHSPAKHGVYFSLLLRPGVSAVDASMITSAAAVAASRAIEEFFTGVQVGIKWVNDLFVNGKKVCGILTEAAFDMESGLVESVVLGIGINITKPEDGLPDELGDVVATLTDSTSGSDGQRNRLIAATLDNFWELYLKLSDKEFLGEYRSRSIVLGREIYVMSGVDKKAAHALEIDDDCGLVVRYENGEIATLASGEVSIRPR
ncbi:MAG: biotin--[acetyl-CoA-carboxylase] ligase [Oscillospiraceae bacterium]|nr:biotin--[acetyl-CoA-carboxylase] ligase [Oscillospiraceae bacterium]